jgi:hypothetical protein
MSTSGSIDYSVNRDTIITETLEILAVLGEGESPSSDQLTSLGRTLNLMVKAWQAEGTNLFAVQRQYVFLQKDTHEFSLGPSGAHFTTSFVETTIATAGSATDLTIEVADITGMSSGDNIGIELDDGTLQWTTINGAPTGTTVTITAALTGVVAASRVVYTYTTKANRPMRITDAVLRDNNSIDTPVNIVPLSDYVALPTKTSDGQVVTIYYDRQVGTGILHTWPETDSVKDRLVIWVQRTLEDFDAASDDADYPQEWYMALVYGLAHYVIPKYGIPDRLANRISRTAEVEKNRAESFDVSEYIKFEPDYEGHS